MSDGRPIIVLYYKEGPAAGQVIAVVDAPRFSQAEFVVAERYKGTATEQDTLRQMMDNRLAMAEAAKEVGF